MDPVLEKLKIQLELQEWPDVYMFKFIVPNVDIYFLVYNDVYL